MFHLVCISWLLFRADTITQAWEMFRLIVTDLRPTWFAWSSLAMVAFYVGPLVLFELWLYASDDLMKLIRVRWYGRALVYSYGVLMIVFFPAPVANAFIYFRF